MQFPPPDHWCLKKNNCVWGNLTPSAPGLLCLCDTLCIKISIPKMHLYSSYGEAVAASADVDRGLVPEKVCKVFHSYKLKESGNKFNE